MISKQSERLRRMKACLEHVDKIHIKELARLIEVSEMTIRRDISSKYSDKYGLESYGGFVRNNIQQMETTGINLTNSILKTIDDDDIELCKKASKIITNSDVVFFDNHELNSKIIENIDKLINFTGITFSLNTFLELKTKPNCIAILLGGTYDKEMDIFKTDNISDWFESVVFTKSFIFSAGVHPDFGITIKDSYMSLVINNATKRTVNPYFIHTKSTRNKISSVIITAPELYSIICTNQD